MVSRISRALLVMVLAAAARCAPVRQPEGTPFEDPARRTMPLHELEKHLEDLLSWYYDNYVEHKIDSHDVMMGDQPAATAAFDQDADGPQRLQGLDPSSPLHVNLSSIVNLTKYSDESHNLSDVDYVKALRDRRDSEVEDRTKDTWIQVLKDNILRQVGRSNSSTSIPVGEMSTINISPIFPNLHIPNDSVIDDDSVAHKIRSYYPSCEIPKNTDQEVWKDENTMNLYFNVDHGPEENGISIATATLRLYRLPHDNSSAPSSADSSCEESSSGEDDRLLRISIYWYTRSLRKHRVKRRLSDSKVVGESAKWVELSVRPATRAWIKGRNLGLAVLVEDQDGTVLKADKYFKGASCTVGASTPKPIPTVIIDAARNELERSNGHSGRNSTAALHNHVPLLPTIDICTLELPPNASYNPLSLASLRTNACDLKKSQDQAQRSLERERLEKLAALAGLVPSSRHIRHQRQHMQDIGADPRSRMVGKKVILTNTQLRSYNTHLAQGNSTSINR